ncbi:MAG: hypothetical protein AAB457_00760, partial [Patescibacteria group bacterium]
MNKVINPAYKRICFAYQPVPERGFFGGTRLEDLGAKAVDICPEGGGEEGEDGVVLIRRSPAENF